MTFICVWSSPKRSDEVGHTDIFHVVDILIARTGMREQKQFVHDVNDAVGFSEMLCNEFCILIAALAHQRHFALPCIAVSGLLISCRSIIDEHLFRLIILVVHGRAYAWRRDD